MSARRSVWAKRAREADARSRSPRKRSGLLIALPAVGWFPVWVLLMVGAIVESAALAVAASVVAVAWAAMCVTATYQHTAMSRFPWSPRLGAPRRRWWSGEWWLVPLMALLVSPAATHWLAGRSSGGRLHFGAADAGTLETARLIGWVAMAVVLIGCPTGWLLGRRHRTEAT